MATSKFIRVNNGRTIQVIETTAETIGDLFSAEFREDFNISQNARPTINNIVVDNNTPITPDALIGFEIGASAKS